MTSEENRESEKHRLIELLEAEGFPIEGKLHNMKLVAGAVEKYVEEVGPQVLSGLGRVALSRWSFVKPHSHSKSVFSIPTNELFEPRRIVEFSSLNSILIEDAIKKCYDLSRFDAFKIDYGGSGLKYARSKVLVYNTEDSLVRFIMARTTLREVSLAEIAFRGAANGG